MQIACQSHNHPTLLYPKEGFSFSFCHQKENRNKRKSAKTLLLPKGRKNVFELGIGGIAPIKQ